MNFATLIGAIPLLLVTVQSAVAQTCYESTLVSPTPFMGNNGELFRLEDGSIWEVKYEYEYLYEYYPTVVVCPGTGKLLVDGKTLNVSRITSAPQQQPTLRDVAQLPSVIESRISGEFTGWEGETIFKLDNGQIWQQGNFSYKYSYKYRPQVLIIRVRGQYEMQVEGIDERIPVRLLN